MQQTMFVEAGKDFTFEEDDIYYSYFESAKLQKDLMKKQKKDGIQTWSFEHYKKFQKRRLESVLMVQSMMDAEPGWELKVHNQDFDKIPDVHPRRSDGKYHFRGETFDNYIKQVQS